MDSSFYGFVAFFIGILVGVPFGYIAHKVKTGGFDAQAKIPKKDPLAEEWENQSKGYK